MMENEIMLRSEHSRILRAAQERHDSTMDTEKSNASGWGIILGVLCAFPLGVVIGGMLVIFTIIA
jgi:hypothetical protein